MPLLLDECVADGLALGLARPDDAAALLALRTDVYPEYATEPSQLHLATQLDAPRDAPDRYLVVDLANSRLVAYAATWRWTDREPKYRMDLMVDPPYRCRGLGTMLFDRPAPPSRGPRPGRLLRGGERSPLRWLQRHLRF
jgi:GNAT superfamily N-acetyltransferase